MIMHDDCVFILKDVKLFYYYCRGGIVPVPSHGRAHDHVHDHVVLCFFLWDCPVLLEGGVAG